MDNPEKLVTYGTQNEEKQSKNTIQYVSNITMRKHGSKDKANIGNLYTFY